MGKIFSAVSVTTIKAYAPSVFFGDLGSLPGAGISVYHGKIFSLNILNAAFSRCLKTFEGYLLSIPDFK